MAPGSGISWSAWARSGLDGHLAINGWFVATAYLTVVASE
jgi:hypothetical protein